MIAGFMAESAAIFEHVFAVGGVAASPPTAPGLTTETGSLIEYNIATLVFQAREHKEYQMNFYQEML